MSETEAIAIILFVLVVSVGVLVAIGMIAKSKGRDVASWVILGIFLGGLIPLIIVSCLPDVRPRE